MMTFDMLISGGLTLMVAYGLGAIPVAVLLAKAMRLPDPRSYGSGNPGATNMLRGGGHNSKRAAILTLIFDALKGALAVLLAQKLGGVPALALLGAVLGHCFSFWLAFKGGKGVATAIGALAVYQPMLAAAVMLVFIGVMLVSRMVSLSSALAALAAPFMLMFGAYLGLGVSGSWFDIGCLAILSAVVIVRHRQNLHRVWLGTESQWGKK